MKTLFQRSGLLFFIGVIIVLGFFGCRSEVWQPVTNPEKLTKMLDCGEEQILYTNNSDNMEMLIFKFDNKCEFSAYTWAGEGDSTLTTGTQTTIPGRHSIQSSVELFPGESFIGICSMVSTVANEGCSVTYWLSATKKIAK